MTKKYQKLYELDAFQALLCLAVTVIHLTAVPISAITEKSSLSYIFLYASNKLLCFAVPAFLFLSGLKLRYVNKGRELDIKRFYIGRVKKILIPYYIALSVYFLAYLYFGFAAYDAKSLLSYIFCGTLVGHFYYIVLAVQFYLIFPIINRFFEKIKLPLLIISPLLTFIFGRYISFPMSDRFFPGYIFYFVLGMYIGDAYELFKINFFKKTYAIPLFSVWSVLAFLIVKNTYVPSSSAVWFSLYVPVSILYITISIFCVLFISVLIEKALPFLREYISSISKYSFYIYLYHVIVIQFLYFAVFPKFQMYVKDRFFYSSVLLLASVLILPYAADKIVKRIKKGSVK